MIRTFRNVCAPLLFLPVLASCGASESEEVTIGYASSAIANGTVDEDDKYVVGVMAFDGGMCSGSLIAPNVVLTARHCIAPTSGQYVECGNSPFGNNFQPNRVYVTTDTRFRQNADWYGVKEIRTPDTGNDTCGYDVALLILSSNVPSNVTKPINPRIDSPPEKGELYTAIGYGQTCDSQNGSCPQGPAGTRRRQDGLEVRCTRGKCSPSSQIKSSEWNGEKDVCSGDSGGPALDSLGRVIGVASRGGALNGECVWPIYSGVDSWKDLITQAVLDAAEMGGYTPPKWATTGDSTQDLPPFDPGSPGTGGSGGSGGGDADGGATDGGDVDETDGGVEAECSSNNQCGEGEACVEGVCVIDCGTGNSCGDESFCNADTSKCEPLNQADPDGDAVDDVKSSWSCAVSQSTDPTKPVPWLVGLALIPFLRRLGSRRS